MLRVLVPATSANLGPGFDCLGLAVDLRLEVRMRRAPRDRFAYRGEGSLPDDPANLVHEGARAACAAVGTEAPPLEVEARNPIPLARGLGSSSAALVAGAAAADALLGLGLGRDGVFALAARLEGHPDNVAPAVYGGFTASVLDDGVWIARSLPIPTGWRLMFGVPDFELPTAQARAALPTRYERADAVFTAGRTALWTLAVIRDEPELLRAAARDRLHEPHREPLVPGLAACREELRAAGAWAAFLSGAGPTVGAVLPEAARDACRAAMRRFVGDAGRVLEPSPASGYEVRRDEEAGEGSDAGSGAGAEAPSDAAGVKARG